MQNLLSGVKNLFIAFAVLCLAAQAFFAQENNSKEAKNAVKRAQQAARVFNEVMDKTDKSIPRELLERAEAIAIFPGVIKAAFIVGGRGGEGVISRRTPVGWSAPAFFKIGGGSFGAQIGADKTDYILLIMNDGGLKGMLEDKFQFGGEAGVAAGPIGRTASAETNATLDAGILSYSRSQGAFIGAALTGAVVAPDKDKNLSVYGKTAKEVLSANTDQANSMPDGVRAVPETLSRFSTRRGSSTNPSTGTMNRTDRREANSNSRARISGGATPEDNNSNDSAMANPDSPAAEGNEIYTVSRSQRRPNARLAREIRAELLSLPYYGVFDWLEFEVTQENVVILRGQATRPTLKSDAQSVVEEVEGVARVQNEIEVLPVSPNDDRLRESLYRTIYSGPLSRYATGALNSIHIIVKNGRVTLKGLVDSEGDRNYANIQANTVSGVFEVRNELLIETSESRRQ